MFPNLSLFVLFTDDHELSMAHARVYNDYVAEMYLAYENRMRPTAAIPLTDIGDALVEIERIVKLGLRAILLPEIPPVPYYSDIYDPIWAAAQAHGLPIFIHVATGGVNVAEDYSLTGGNVKALMTAVAMGQNPMDMSMLSSRSMGGGATASESPQKIIGDIVSSGVCERFPNVHFNLIEFNAGWLVSYLGSLDKAWRTGIGQDPDWWLGFWDKNVPANQQPSMGRLFNVNSKWPWPLKPSEYVRRQFHIQFADDPVAVAARHITGLTTIMWGNDYPHAEGTFRQSKECIDLNFVGVDAEDRAGSSVAPSPTSSGSTRAGNSHPPTSDPQPNTNTHDEGCGNPPQPSPRHREARPGDSASVSRQRRGLFPLTTSPRERSERHVRVR